MAYAQEQIKAEALLQKIWALSDNKAADLLSELVGYKLYDSVIVDFCQKWLEEHT
jgi:beta-lactamase class A